MIRNWVSHSTFPSVRPLCCELPENVQQRLFLSFRKLISSFWLLFSRTVLCQKKSTLSRFEEALKSDPNIRRAKRHSEFKWHKGAKNNRSQFRENEKGIFMCVREGKVNK